MLCSIFFTLLAYLLGSIPFGVIIGKLLGVPDLRIHGSGNIGATNAWRVGGQAAGILTFIGDAAKGAILMPIFPQYPYLVFIVIFGHMFSIFLKMSGGKGVSTFFGTIFAINFSISLLFALCWLSIFKVIKISAVASLVCITLFAILMYLKYPIFGWYYIASAALIWYKHIPNLRLLTKKSRH